MMMKIYMKCICYKIEKFRLFRAVKQTAIFQNTHAQCAAAISAPFPKFVSFGWSRSEGGA